jgi:hypothetical protein
MGISSDENSTLAREQKPAKKGNFPTGVTAATWTARQIEANQTRIWRTGTRQHE